MPETIAFILFPLISYFPFRYFETRIAIAIVYFGGLIFLPIADFGPRLDQSVLHWQIVGTAIPSNLLVTKSWISGLVALAYASVFDLKSAKVLRPNVSDVLMIAWCMWPIAANYFLKSGDPKFWISSLYLSGVWGIPWILGRVWFSGYSGQKNLLWAIVFASVILLPIVAPEFFYGPFVYDVIYDWHPFRFDGHERYLFFRPLAFFENGNLFGLWVACAGLASVWILFDQTSDIPKAQRFVLLAVAITLAISSQSIGAILLFAAALLFLAFCGAKWIHRLFWTGVFLLLCLLALHFSGIVPLEYIARQTQVGHLILDAARNVGRGSFLWRISQDAQTLEYFHASPWIGTATWNWWNEAGTRPWGLLLLVVGQFGIIGLVLLTAAMLTGAIRVLKTARKSVRSLSNRPDLVLALIVIMAFADAILNSFFYFPAILAAASISSRAGDPEDERRI